METSEVFLLVWACIATILAVLYREGAKSHLLALKKTSVLLAEIVVGEVVPTKKGDMWIVENDDMKLAFKTRDKQ